MTTTKSKLMYRIFLKSGATKLCEELALTAARSNGEEQPIAFDFITMMAQSVKKLDDKGEDMSVEISDNDKWFCIDMKSPEWKGYKTVLRIEQVKILEPFDKEVEDAIALENLSQMGAQC